MLQILVAEDNPGDVFLIRRALAEHNIPHELHVAHDGEEAIEFVAKVGQPGGVPCLDLLLLDLNLPKADGPQVLAELRKHPECAATPVVVVTSSDAAKDRERMAELGISRYFRKPSDLESFMKLGSVVREVLENQTV